MTRSISARLCAGALAITVLVPALVSCGPSDDLVIYSGRNEALVQPILDQLEEAVGTDVEVRYGGSAELAAQLQEEGDKTEADLFFSQDAGALGALSEAGRLAELPAAELRAVPERFRADDGTWVATSARARVVAYDSQQVTEKDLPGGVDDLLDPKWRGKIGYAPTNASWQAFVTALRVLKGESGAKDWLLKFKANDPQAYDNNVLILDAVNAGQVPIGLINHYYYFRKAKEVGADKLRAKLHYVGGNDPLALINVAGVGMLKGSDKAEAARKAVAFLLAEQAQRFFADQTAEYPVRDGVRSTKHDLPTLSGIESPDIDLTKLSSLDQTLKLLQEVGLP